MNKYVIEHRSIEPGGKVTFLEEVLAETVQDASRYARKKYRMTTMTEVLHVRRAA